MVYTYLQNHFNSVDRNNLSTLLRDLNIMLSVTQGLRPNVDTDKLRELGIQIMKDIKTNFLDYKGKSWI